MDNLDFLDSGQPENADTQPAETPREEPAEQPEAEQSEVEAPQQETAAEADQRERDERGRFKAKEQSEPVMVPLQALHETRDEVKALKAQLAALQQPQQPQQVPDIFENPEGYAQHLQDQIAQVSLNDRLNLSEELVRQSAGDETVNAAQEWGKQILASNPMFAQAFYAQRNPYGFLLNEYRRHQTLAQLGDADPNEVQAFLAWKSAQGQAPQPGIQPNPQPTPPKSIASATSAGGVQTIATGPTVAFDNIFTR